MLSKCLHVALHSIIAMRVSPGVQSSKVPSNITMPENSVKIISILIVRIRSQVLLDTLHPHMILFQVKRAHAMMALQAMCVLFLH